MNNKKVADVLTEFILKKVEPFEGVVIGMSGGIDSAVVAKLCADAIGPENMLSVVMPAYDESVKSQNHYDALEWSHALNLETNVFCLNDTLKVLDGHRITFIDKLVEGNITARLRMIVLYAYANKMNRLVAGTTNKSEAMVGYYTKWGDGAVDFEPIIDLYKTEVRELARYLGVPEKIITKSPTADLWKGQTDEDELGMSYAVLDEYLKGHQPTNDVEAEVYNRVQQMIRNSEHKRVMPDGPNLGGIK